MTTDKVPSIKYMKELQDSFEQDLPEMIQRLEQIKKIRTEQEHLILSLIAENYLEESYRCYLHGNYISFLTMLAFSFEILFRKIFDEKRFVDLIARALENNLITSNEANEIHWLRKFRNTTHIVDDIFPTHDKRDYEIDFYRDANFDVHKMVRRGFKLIPVIIRIQLNSLEIIPRLTFEGKMRSPPDLSYFKRKLSSSSKHTRSRNTKNMDQTDAKESQQE